MTGWTPAPVPIAQGTASLGGLTFDDHGRLIVGYRSSVTGGLVGTVVGRAGLLRIHPDIGEREVHATALSMGQRCRASRGRHSRRLERLRLVHRPRRPARTVDRRWARVPSANGLALDPTGRYP